MIYEDTVCKIHDIGKGWDFYTGSATKNKLNSTMGGVGILLSPNACKSLINIEPTDPRFIIATFNGNPSTTILCCYSSTNVSEDFIAEQLYSELASLINQIPKHHVTIVAGDMNAQIGKDDFKGTPYHKNTNRNGQLLLDVISECDLINLTTN